MVAHYSDSSSQSGEENKLLRTRVLAFSFIGYDFELIKELPLGKEAILLGLLRYNCNENFRLAFLV